MPSEAEEHDPRARPMMICARLAGRAIIRVVGRCEDAQENSQLGKYLLTPIMFLFRSYLANYSYQNNITKKKILRRNVNKRDKKITTKTLAVTQFYLDILKPQHTMNKT